ncbi:hypothetical protein [Coraliomargarita akajimensis]|uniref:Secreted protein n=1 Tax=Coraliomargarita akajimensis (strain DSM 45221 / IAM 15411 / JCM 23193 / KCTC 12865 / 04OKA010-24) TaxID=583355 RepID=D5EIH2_CORAD|nr:hypothetical protein [Coraliomargarita akajimensis]ADE54238.1 hypothetical protein Caka_1218 [Coraliomargarita akajimensis DSM 45221]
MHLYLKLLITLCLPLELLAQQQPATFYIYQQDTRHDYQLQTQCNSKSSSLPCHTLSLSGPFTAHVNEEVQILNSNAELVHSFELTSSDIVWLLLITQEEKLITYPLPPDETNNQLSLINQSGFNVLGMLGTHRIQVQHAGIHSLILNNQIRINLWTLHPRTKQPEQILMKQLPSPTPQHWLLILFPPVLQSSTEPDVRLLKRP